jgi:hypothetical protein
MVHRDGHERRKLSVWIIFTFFFVAILGKTAHTFSPPQRIHFRSYPVLNQPKVPFRLGDSNLQGDRSDSENASDHPEQEAIYQNATLSMTMKQGSSEEPLNVEPPNVIESKPTTTEAPSTRTILKFAIPAIGIWLCSPLMSIIDTSTVGLISGTAQQAALNPAIAVTDYSARCMVRKTHQTSMSTSARATSLTLYVISRSSTVVVSIYWNNQSCRRGSRN